MEKEIMRDFGKEYTGKWKKHYNCDEFGHYNSTKKGNLVALKESYLP